MNNLINIPKSSILYVGVDNICPSDDTLEKHHSIIVATLSNNKRLADLSDDLFDSRWVFQSEELSQDFTHGYLAKHIILVPVKKLVELTPRSTLIDKVDDEKDNMALVCVIPMNINEDNDPIGRLVNSILISGGFSLKKIPDFFRYEIAIKQIQRDNKKFWDRYGPVPNVITQFFNNRRFRNEEFAETDDYSVIQTINTPVRIDGYTFSNNNDDGSVPSGGNWDGMDWREELRSAMGIQPLELDDYEAYCTYEDMEEVFRVISRFEDNRHVMKELFITILKNFFTCHLIFHSKFIMKKLKGLMSLFEDNEDFTSLKEINQSLLWGMYTLYAEELLLGGNLKPEHRCVWNIYSASNLPVFKGKNLHESPYLCLPIQPDAMSLGSNFLGLCRNDVWSVANMGRRNWNSDEYLTQTDLKFFTDGVRLRGILSPNQVRASLVEYTHGMLEDLNDGDIYLTGSGGEACLYDNPLFRRGHYHFDNIYPIRDMDIIGKNIPTHNHSDIDLVVFTDSEDVLVAKAKKIKSCLEENLCNEIEMIRVNRTKFRFTGKTMKREIDLFMSNKSPPGLLFNYHISTCRVAIPLVESMTGMCSGAMMMTSMVISSHLGFCVDRRWFSSKTSLYDRILKQYSRGIGMMLNMYEIQMIKDYLENSPKWGYMKDMIQIHQVPGQQNRRYIQTHLPSMSGKFFRSTTKHQVGQYYRGQQYINGQINVMRYTNGANTPSYYRYNYNTKSEHRNIRESDGSFVNK